MVTDRTSAGCTTRPLRPDQRRFHHLLRRARLCVLAACIGLAASARGAGLPTEPQLLPPEQAFRLSARALDARTLEIRYDVADGYYLYREKLAFSVDPDAGAGKPELPSGIRKHDEFFGDVETYRGRLVVRLPLARGKPGQTVALKAESQGCADAGICYPPTQQQLRLVLPAEGARPGPIVEPARKKGLFD
jgi:thiol:disulfide interchange protein DsbD